MSFDEWLDKFTIFLKGYYCGLSVEQRCRRGSVIMEEAVRAFVSACNETDWIEEKEEDS